ncbi:metallophosphoesterase family protein [Clostridium baratii]|uniref:metallophosphoesterase family protein n=1 Tax=Clostridium baratii TaxID=1561 RepID=UPI0005F2F333|nr:DNA repair exonuclease [Clostridium baratii]AQM60454.1 DNA repair exonuclease [Clostridium baratii]KJU73192.1 phosphoesterase [Clostridium baratii]MBS6041706.1 DNA repair exonuclease [Clostridium baratii]
MKTIKILHCADIHFDTPFKEFTNEYAIKSKEEIKEVFSRIIDICNNEKIQVMLLAGDIFDNYTVSKSTLAFIKESLEKLEITKVFISPGNHDPYNFKSFYKLIDWPENVHVFKENAVERVVLDELNLCVHGCGFTESYINESMLKDIDLYDGYINIGVIHGEIANGNSKNEYNPITLNDIEKSKLDYLALGHRHKFTGVFKEGKTSYAYSGCPQGRGFDETGEKGVLVGDVSIGYTNLSFIKTCKREYIEKEIDISSLFGYKEVKDKILLELKDFNIRKDIFKLTLVGSIEANFKINENILNEKLSNDFYFVKIKDNTNVISNLDEVYNEHSIKGIFINNLNEKMKSANKEEKEIIELALKIGLQSLTSEEVNLDDY